MACALQGWSKVIAALFVTAATYNQLHVGQGGLVGALLSAAGGGGAEQLAQGQLPAGQLPPGQRHLAAAPYYRLWGVAGENFTEQGPFMDFSFAGYRHNNEVPPSPPATRSLRDFRAGQAGRRRSDSEALLAMVGWANRQPLDAGWLVLSIPRGTFRLEAPLTITRPRTVLRGAGSARTKLYVPRSLMQLYGPTNETNNGFYVWTGAFISLEGTGIKRTHLAHVAAPAPRGSHKLRVDSAAAIRPGDMVTLELFANGGPQLQEELLNHKLQASKRFRDKSIRFSSRVWGVSGRVVTLERALPLDVAPEFGPVLTFRQPRLYDAGVEGLTLAFRWEAYGGHHLEHGWSGIEVSRASDCWVRDVAFVNADNGVLVDGADRVTLRGLQLSVTRSRAGGPEGKEGHWGVRVGRSADIRVTDFAIAQRTVHSVGADTLGQLSVIERGVMRQGNLELHRALAAQCLFTDIHLGNASGGAYAGGGFYSGGPPASGPNTGAWTVFWNIRSNSGVLPLPQHNKGRPGACTFGPDLTFVGVNFDAVQLARYGLCQDWYYQPGEISPPNLFWSQLQLRRHLLAKLKVEGERGAWTVTQPLHITIVDDPPAPSAAPSQQQDQQQQQQQQQQRAPGAPQAQLLGGGLEATATA
ncbi:hypothetical protein CHLNCDRAFT_145616 [Chlorella variabilis]|uniref:Right handed beta helix domain-containing protein n=1 Tax=Chlorella variabilis TaxID=554065 RepID=E1ZDV1_CHLVA|nr:hypothetical protein CHLNCDRAFT_145616 [Chlorella variabilis]EFN55921.1 hypothetical protein CHLNCDRAFT_145616 [Chlorella variabilis]|eukprot:XP_005848023.1 hypothetical protein CHLNCDRAFT_145616 [Chlorella variabilis]